MNSVIYYETPPSLTAALATFPEELASDIKDTFMAWQSAVENPEPIKESQAYKDGRLVRISKVHNLCGRFHNSDDRLVKNAIARLCQDGNTAFSSLDASEKDMFRLFEDVLPTSLWDKRSPKVGKFHQSPEEARDRVIARLLGKAEVSMRQLEQQIEIPKKVVTLHMFPWRGQIILKGTVFSDPGDIRELIKGSYPVHDVEKELDMVHCKKCLTAAAKPTEESDDNRRYLLTLDYFVLPWKYYETIRYWKGDIIDEQAIVEYLLKTDFPVKQITRRDFIVCDYVRDGGIKCGIKTFFGSSHFYVGRNQPLMS